MNHGGILFNRDGKWRSPCHSAGYHLQPSLRTGKPREQEPPDEKANDTANK